MQKPVRIRISLGALRLCAALALSLFCLRANAADAPKPDLSGITIVVGQQGAETEGIFVESGAFKDAPYKVEYATFASPSDTLTALASGRVDVGNNIAQWTATQASAAASPAWTAQTAPYKNILVNEPTNTAKFERFVAVASAQSKITDIHDSKGKIWGFLPGTSGHLFAAKVLEKLGWTFNDIQVVNLDSTNQVLALQTGRVDVIFNPRDNLLPAMQRGAKLIGEAYQYDTIIYTGYLANVRALNDPVKGVAMEDFATRVIRALDWFVQNPAQAQAALVKYRKMTPEQARLTWLYSRQQPVVPSAEIAAYSQRLADTALKFGLVSKPVDARALLDDRYAKSIEKTLAETHFDEHLKASYNGD